jgi:hypothetical protein
MDARYLERSAKKILDVLADGKITGLDLMYVAFYTVMNAHPRDPVLDRLIEYVEHVKVERERYERENVRGQDSIF